MASNFEPLISIITLTYNHQDYIAECIESVMCQTYPNWEMIIVDDASTDKTPYIVEQYLKKDSRIKFIRNEKNNGPLFLDANYNLALKEAKGEWIGYLEGDDVFTPKSLQHRVEALKFLSDEDRENISLVYGRYGRIWMDAKVIDRPIPYYENDRYANIINNKPVGQSLLWFLQGFNFIPAASVLINKKKLNKIGGFKQYPREIKLVDYCTWTYLALEGEFLYLPKTLYFWRRHSGSITMKHHEEIEKSFLDFVNFFWSNHKKQILERIKFTNFQNCLGVQAKLELAKLYLLKRNYKTASNLLSQVELCPYIKEFFPEIFKKKLLVTKIANKLKLPMILDFALYFKRRKLDKIIGNYEPFFFKYFKEID
ncbi:MAG: hypothetical protein DRP29_04695 [Thermodesulfobacteriota bacterium]|nr:MAG: hypothetical protein DRP29_04695 [Thermodesulfobacteriota bacterium]